MLSVRMFLEDITFVLALRAGIKLIESSLRIHRKDACFLCLWLSDHKIKGL